MPACIAALVRHGDYHQLADVPSAQQPFALTDEGRTQAEKGAAELMQIITAHGWSIYPGIDSSNMLRAWQTAQIFAGVCGTKSVASFDSLAERGLGCAANLTLTLAVNALPWGAYQVFADFRDRAEREVVSTRQTAVILPGGKQQIRVINKKPP